MNIEQYRTLNDTQEDVIILNAKSALMVSGFLSLAKERLSSDDYNPQEELVHILSLLDTTSKSLLPYWLESKK